MDTLQSKQGSMAAIPLLRIMGPDAKVIEFGANKYVTSAIADRASMAVTVEPDGIAIRDVLNHMGGRDNHRFVHAAEGAATILSMDINEHADFYLVNMSNFKNCNLINAAIVNKLSKMKNRPVVIARNYDHPLIRKACESYQHVRSWRASCGMKYAVCCQASSVDVDHIEDVNPDYRVSVYICTRDGNPHRNTLKSVENDCAGHHSVKIIKAGFSVAHCRNKAVNDFLHQNPADAMLFVDDSVVIPEGTIEALYSCRGDIVSACVPTYQSIGSFDVPIVTVKRGGHWFLTWPKKKPFRISACGMACTLIRRRVFDKMGFPYFIWPRDHDINWLTSEDAEFCGRAEGHGYEIWCNGAVQCGHYKTVDVGQHLLESGEKIPSKTWKGPNVSREHILRQADEDSKGHTGNGQQGGLDAHLAGRS